MVLSTLRASTRRSGMDTRLREATTASGGSWDSSPFPKTWKAPKVSWTNRRAAWTFQSVCSRRGGGVLIGRHCHEGRELESWRAEELGRNELESWRAEELARKGQERKGQERKGQERKGPNP
jgi:hypothetical protein